MQPDASHNVSRHIPWLPGETFELALDAKEGLLAAPSASAVLIVTSHRVIVVDRRAGRRATTIAPLSAIGAVEVVEVARPIERLWQGLIVLGGGVLLAWVTWALFSVALITVVVGGLPILASVYILLDYVFPNARGELALHAHGGAIRCALQSRAAQRGAYAAAHRLSALQAGIDLAGAQDAPAEADAEPWEVEEGAPEPETEAAPIEAIAEAAGDAPAPMVAETRGRRRLRRARRRAASGRWARRRVWGVRRRGRGRARAERLRWRKRKPSAPRAAQPRLRGGYAGRRLRRFKVGKGVRFSAGGGGGIGARALAIAGRGLPAVERLARRVL